MGNKKQIDVVLADPPNPKWNPYARGFPNIGLLYLASYLREKLSNVVVHHLDFSQSYATHLDRIAQIKPDVYGLSLASPFADPSVPLLREIKERFPDLTIVCGGAHPSAAAEDFLANSYVDICVIGEGEKTFVDIVRAVAEGGTLTDIEGTAYRDPNGKVAFAPQRALFSDLDEIPFPAWDLVDFNDYVGCRKAKGKPSMAIVASRGCPYNCGFCSNPVWRQQKPWLRLRSPDSIAAEAQLLYERGVREIYLRSDEMNPNINWAIEVFDAMAGLNLPDLHFQCNLRAKPVTSALAAAMKRAGCWLCHIGLESASERVLKGIHKGVTPDEVAAAAQVMKEYDIKVYTFVMLYQAWEKDGAVQHESTSEVMKTLNFVAKMRLKGLVDFMSWGFATPYPGSRLNDVCDRFDLRRYNAVSTEDKGVTPHDIPLRLPGVPSWHMTFARTLGLSMQAALFLLARDSYRLKTLRTNFDHALFKSRYALNLKAPR